MTIERDGESTLRLEGLRITDGGPFVCQVNIILFINKIILFKIINNIVIFNNITAIIESTPGGDGRRRSFGGGASSYCPGFQNSV